MGRVGSLLGLLPILFFVSVVRLRVVHGSETPRAIVDAFIAWGIASFVSAEFFGLFSSISFVLVLFFWLIITIVAFILNLRAAGAWRPLQSLRWNPAFAVTLIFIVVTLFIALTAEPNSWDSQAYHLARIEHWIQNGSLQHYPTSPALISQNAMGTLAEIMILHTRLLGETDGFSILIQWISMVTTTFAVHRITQQLGGGETERWLAVVFAVTLPMGVLQATSTQNDYVAAAFLCCFVSLGLELLSQPVPRTDVAIEAMFAGAMSGAVKPTAYLMGAGFAIWFTIVSVRKIAYPQLLAWAALAMLILIVFAGPFAVRNVSSYGTAQSPIANITNNSVVGIPQTLDNLILNTVLNFATGNLQVDAFTKRATLAITASLHLDAYRPQTTVGEFGLMPRGYTNHEDYAPNSIHTLLILISLTVLAFRWRRKSLPSFVGPYWLSWIAGVLCFCAILRWQVWNVRLQLSGFLLAAPLFALALPSSRSVTQKALLATLVYAGIFPLLLNTNHQLLPTSRLGPSYLSAEPLEQLFNARINLLEPYVAAVNALSQANAAQIGLVIDDFEYPLWRLFHDGQFGLRVRIEHVGFAKGDEEIPRFNPTGVGTIAWPRGSFIPDAVVWFRPEPPAALFVAGQKLVRQNPSGPVVVYTRQSSGTGD
jgi:hypothetical protein